MTKYVVQDITTADKWAFFCVDGSVKIVTTTDTASANPIVKDDADPLLYWEIIVDDGQIAIRSTLTERDDEIDLDDSSLGNTFRLSVNDGQFNYYAVGTVVEGNVFAIRTGVYNLLSQTIRLF
jgi:hypothetical protein